MRFWIKQNDTGPALRIIPISDVPINLTGASAQFLMKRVHTDTLVINEAATISGDIISYIWQDGDTDIAGRYQAEFEVALADLTVRTFPNPGYIDITIYEDLGQTSP